MVSSLRPRHGSVAESLLDFFVIGELSEPKAFSFPMFLAFTVLFGCDLLSFSRDHQHRYRGATTNPGLFIAAGVFLSILGAMLYSFLHFTKQGFMTGE